MSYLHQKFFRCLARASVLCLLPACPTPVVSVPVNTPCVAPSECSGGYGCRDGICQPCTADDQCAGT